MCIPHKRYARKDVYKRHLRQKHELDEPFFEATNRRRRVRTACDNCHARKVKCDSLERPCERCQAAGLLCISETVTTGPERETTHQIYNFRDSIDTVMTSHEAIVPSAPASGSGPEIVSTTLLEQDPFSMFPNDIIWWDNLLPEGHDDLNFFPDGLPAQLSLSFDSSRATAAYAKLYEFTGMPHPDHPSSAPEQRQYLQELGSTEPLTYDPVIINIFIGLFHEHLAPKFPGFPNCRMATDIPEALYLAMAANGGLYCKTPKAEKVAKNLLFAAGRSLLTMKHSRNPLAPVQKLYALQTVSLT